MSHQRSNPLLALPFEPSLEGLGPDYWDVVEAARFPLTRLRFRNDDLLVQLGLDPAAISDGNLEAAYGRFEARTPLLALRYHGYQFGSYNPFLGDGRGFLYGQLRDCRGDLQDLGTKGSGTTPWSRGGDGRLTLKGGVRELIASEALHRLGVSTSRTLSLVETGEDLWRGDEPSPTRSSVMVRLARTHLRFGTCERLLHRREPQALERLLRHVVRVYYPHISEAHPVGPGGNSEPALLAFYGELVERVAQLAAEWMVAGFTHGVLNTDNMSLAGESFDYGPFAFLEGWDPGFTAAYFDHSGLYAYGQQPLICHHNLRLLQEPLAMLLPRAELESRLERFSSAYDTHFHARLMRRLGFDALALPTSGAGCPRIPSSSAPSWLDALIRRARPGRPGGMPGGRAARPSRANGRPRSPPRCGAGLCPSRRCVHASSGSGRISMSTTTGSPCMTGWTGADPATVPDPGARRYSFLAWILSEFVYRFPRWNVQP